MENEISGGHLQWHGIMGGCDMLKKCKQVYMPRGQECSEKWVDESRKVNRLYVSQGAGIVFHGPGASKLYAKSKMACCLVL